MKKLIFDAFLLIFLKIASFWMISSIKPVQFYPEAASNQTPLISL